jgi:hypothetical protein
MQTIPEAIQAYAKALRLKQADLRSATVLGFLDDTGNCIGFILSYLIPEMDTPYVTTELVKYNLSYSLVCADGRHGVEYTTHKRQINRPAYVLTYILSLEVKADV